jgi:hypothetical protein
MDIIEIGCAADYIDDVIVGEQANVSHRESYIGKFKDKRLDKRAGIVSSMLYFNQSSSIHASTQCEAEQKGAYRFFANEGVEEKILVATTKERSSYLCAGKDLLVLTDTTEFNLKNHHNRLKPDTGIGVTGNNKDLGFFMHTSLVMDAATEAVLGISDVQLWNRGEGKVRMVKGENKRIPIEQKESYKWLKAANASKAHLSAANSITMVEDREGDIYEQFVRIPDQRTHLIVRNRIDRTLSDGRRLYECLAAQDASGSYNIDLIHDIDNRKGIEKRIATVQVRYCKVKMKPPNHYKRKGIAAQIQMNAIEVREVTAGIKKPILWRILTTHKVESYEDAVGIVNKYRLRWYIEQLHRLMKKKGFGMESSELETGWAIRKLTVMVLNSSIRVMQLLLAVNNKESQPIEQVFDVQEIKCLQKLNNKLQGQTEKSKNNNDPKTVSWATWIIAKLGGWKGYNKTRPPGPIILKKGLDKFNSIFNGWNLALDDLKDVS